MYQRDGVVGWRCGVVVGGARALKQLPCPSRLGWRKGLQNAMRKSVSDDPWTCSISLVSRVSEYPTARQPVKLASRPDHCPPYRS